MNKERIKSFVLVCLVMINFILAAKILTDKKLWPYGYNFFVSLEKSDILKVFTYSQDKKAAKTHIATPEQIIVNTGDQTSRIAINPDNEIFSEISLAADEILNIALNSDSKNIFFSTKSEWVSELNGRSLCLNYDIPYETTLFGKFFDADASALSEYLPSLSRIIISENGSVYFEDFNSGNFYKAQTSLNPKKLVSIIDKTKNMYSDNQTIINYSVDLKFDETFGSQKAALSPTVLVYSTPVNMPLVMAINPLLSPNNTLNFETIDKILSIFDINANTVRRYPEVNGTMVFVENDGILKIHPDGVIRYQSTDSRGFSISSGNSYAETLIGIAEFAHSLNAASSSDTDIYLSSEIFENSQKVTFDYRASGVGVEMDFDKYKNAITAEITSDGFLTSYTHVLRNYIPGSTLLQTPEYIKTLDEAIEKYSMDMNNIEIQKIYISYTDSGSFTPKSAKWKTKVKSIVIDENE